MKTTKQCLDYVANHAYYKRKFAKIKNTATLIQILDSASGDFSKDAAKINMFGVDSVKPKDYVLIIEIAMVCNFFRYQ